MKKPTVDGRCKEFGLRIFFFITDLTCENYCFHMRWFSPIADERSSQTVPGSYKLLYTSEPMIEPRE